MRFILLCFSNFHLSFSIRYDDNFFFFLKDIFLNEFSFSRIHCGLVSYNGPYLFSKVLLFM